MTKQKTKTGLIKKTDMTAAIDALIAGGFSVFAPTGEDERQAFSPVSADNAADVNLSGISPLPPKELLFPRSETLFGIALETGEVRQPAPPQDFILLGVRPCDARSFLNLDCAFLEKTYTDSAYAARRAALTVIALACNEIPSRSCFCDSMGGDPFGTEGADVLLSETADGTARLAEFLTEKGERVEALWRGAGLLAAQGGAGSDGGGAKKPSCTLKIEKPKDLPEKLTSAFDDPMWTRFSEACLGCGTCAFVCPTCYCFDIDAEKQGGEAEEFRCWDCCMFSDYSRMAGGHNPRPTKKERLRNRYLHKLAYFDERYGRTLCVGCGRCIAKCPAGLDIASVIEWGGAL